jgi:hypothetical protein
MKPLLAGLGVVVLLVILASVGSSGTASYKAKAAAPADPPKFSSMSSLLTSDQTKISADFQIVVNDATQGQSGDGEPLCYNLQNNVTPDAQAIGAFVSNDVDNDVAKLQMDINTIQADVANFNQDIADFVNDGVPMPAGAAQAVTQISTDVTGEVATANGQIGSMQNDVDAAYEDGNDLATGACSGDGPGKAPAIPIVTS